MKYYELKFCVPTPLTRNALSTFFHASACLCYFWEFQPRLYAYLIKWQHMKRTQKKEIAEHNDNINSLPKSINIKGRVFMLGTEHGLRFKQFQFRDGITKKWNIKTFPHDTRFKEIKEISDKHFYWQKLRLWVGATGIVAFMCHEPC